MSSSVFSACSPSAAPITQPTPIVTPASTAQPERLTPVRDAISLPPPQRRALDAAWAALQPLLSDNHKNKETTP